MSAQPAAAISDAQALSTLLAVEGFLLAAISLSINLDAPDQKRPMSFNRVKPVVLARCAAVVLVIVAVGAVSAWTAIFAGGSYVDITRFLVGSALLVALIAQPALALFLAFGAKRKRGSRG